MLSKNSDDLICLMRIELRLTKWRTQCNQAEFATKRSKCQDWWILHDCAPTKFKCWDETKVKFNVSWYRGANSNLNSSSPSRCTEILCWSEKGVQSALDWIGWDWKKGVLTKR